LSRIEAGRYELNEEAVSLRGASCPSAAICCRCAPKGRRLHRHELFEADLPRLWADERAIRQICLNLLGNAIKFHAAGRRDLAQGRLDRVRGGQYLSVKDTGPGISRGRDPDRARLLRAGIELDQISAEQGRGPWACRSPRAWSTCTAATFSLKSKLRIGTEVVVTFPPEPRDVGAGAARPRPAPPMQPQAPPDDPPAPAPTPRSPIGASACSGLRP